MTPTELPPDWSIVTAQAQGLIDEAGLLDGIPDDVVEDARSVSADFKLELSHLLDQWKAILTVIATRPAPIAVNLTIDGRIRDTVHWGEKQFDPGFSGEVFKSAPWDKKSWIPGWGLRRRKGRFQLIFDPPDTQEPRRFGCEKVAIGYLGKEARLTTVSLNIEPSIFGEDVEDLYIYGSYPVQDEEFAVAYAGTVPCIHCGRTIVCADDPCAQCSGSEDCGQA